MNLDEIKEAVKGEPTLLDGLVEYSIATDKGQEVLKNHSKVEFDKNIGTRIGEIYSGIDNDIKGILGDEKPSDVKTYDNVKTLMTELQGFRKNGSGSDALKAKIKELEGQLKDGNAKHWHDMYTKGLDSWTAKEQEFGNTIEGLNGTIKDAMVKTEIAKGISQITLNSGIPKAAQASIMETAINTLSKDAKIVEGKVILQKLGENGLESWHNATTYAPISAADALKELLGEMLETNPDTGGGAKKDGKFGKMSTIGKGDDAKKVINLDKSKVKSQEQFADAFDDALVELGIGRGTPEWFKLEATTMEQMGVAKLPETI